MLHLAAFLVAAALAAPAVSEPTSPISLAKPPPRTCGADIDPGFVRYVEPPRHTGPNPLFWLVTDDRQALVGQKPPAFDKPPASEQCVRLVRASASR